ncbi:MAG: pyruvate flavodoxin/ferredoxin oxidoreductase [Deltaproteobacteria bacterium RBG_13_49_15]|nr:MAG: pyruvate flavodoxin/ferredoxin oxidoreductase [Deltaproteobacteria bacterium RBG_13_49_15]
MNYYLMDGNEALARGAFAAGCRFFAGYPITPASTIFDTLFQLIPPAGGICMQGEDEIASIGYCLGASMAGMKAMTATSGPGISLYSEQISFAIASEIPIVIVDVQRLGPSTGSATRGADGDIQFLRWGNSGGLPVIVLAPVDVRDCFVLTMHAFNLAERFRCPVFIASNKEIALTRESIDEKDLSPIPIETRSAPSDADRFLPFHIPEGRMTPGFFPIGGEVIVRQTSSTHGQDGYITTNPEEIQKNQIRLLNKIESFVDDVTVYDFFPSEDADTLMISYGVTARAALSAVSQLSPSIKKPSLLILKTLWPVPEKIIREKARQMETIFVVEMNMGQYRREIERILPGKRVRWLGRMDGNLISPRTIAEVLNHE